MVLGVDLYNSAVRLEAGLASIAVDERLRKLDVKDIVTYLNEMSARGVKPIRLKKQLYVLKQLALLLEKPFRECDKDDLMSLVRKVDSVKDHTEWTKYDRKVILKRFYKWINGGEEYPACIKWLKLSDPKNTILPEELVTEEEALRLVECAKYLRDKAFLSVLYESGCRIGELLTLQVKNVTFGEHITSMTVCGKTGQRRVPIVTATPYLSMWMQTHPFKGNPNAPLWTKIVDKWHPGSMEHLSYEAIKKILRNTFKKAGINKKPSAHLFRHSRATFLAKHLTEAQLKEMFGWTQASDMASRYVHLSGRDVDTAIMKLHGIKVREAEEEMLVKQVKCSRCNTMNSTAFTFCIQCGAALNPKTAFDSIHNPNDAALQFIQKMIMDVQQLQGQGMDLQKFSEFMKEWKEKNASVAVVTANNR